MLTDNHLNNSNYWPHSASFNEEESWLTEQKGLKQEVMERTNLPTFPTLFNNAVISLNQLVHKLLRRGTLTKSKIVYIWHA
jgi:hypothetical protein